MPTNDYPTAKTFADYDCFDRQSFAENLTKLVEIHAAQENGAYVLSLNASFGEGKSTFVEMWQNMLKDRGVECIYINAWKHDFDDDPIIPILGTLLEEITGNEDARDVRSNLEKAAGAAAIVSNALFKRFAGINAREIMQEIDDINNPDSQNNIGKQLFIRYHYKQEKFEQLRQCLAEYVSALPSKRIMVFVDELDRARPDYSVKFLETIKHIFPVKNLCFVLSIDRKHLASSVSRLYGNIDFENYYARFITNEVNLPKLGRVANFDNYLDKLYGRFVAPLEDINIQWGIWKQSKGNVKRNMEIISRGFALSARQIEHLYRKFSHFLAVDQQQINSDFNYEPWANASFFLFALSSVDRDLYDNVGTNSVSPVKVLQKINSPSFAYSRREHGSSSAGYIIDINFLVLSFLLCRENSEEIVGKYREHYDESKESNEHITSRLMEYRADGPRLSDKTGFQIIYERFENWQTLFDR